MEKRDQQQDLQRIHEIVGDLDGGKIEPKKDRRHRA
jgi:hypothetical protein